MKKNVMLTPLVLANTLTAADSSTTALGGASDDTIAFGGGRGTFSGGRGNDTLIGSGGNNTYLYSTGDGTDRISDTSAKTIAGAPAPNTLRFGAGVTAADITLGLGSLLIRVGSDPNDAIHIDGFNPDDALASQSIDRFEFDDGSVLTHAELLAKGFDLTGTAGDDRINGTSVVGRISGLDNADLIWRLRTMRKNRRWRDGERNRFADNEISWRVAA